MSRDELDKVRSKVEQGEPLSQAEFDVLRRAAQNEGTASLRLAVAHALLNANAPYEALPLLASLRRDFPRELQVPLGLARALVVLERYREAEDALRDALRLSPGDLEAIKGLAVCAMRRHEVARAHALVDEALKVDPFDPEAQLLRAELDAAPDAPPTSRRAPRVSQAQFTETLVARLRAQPTPYLLQKDQLLVKLGQGGVARLDLGSLYAGYLDEARSEEEAVEAIAQELALRALGAPEEGPALLAKVLPVLRDGAFLERATGAARREGPAGLWVFYVLDDPSLVRYVPEGALPPADVTLEQLDSAAWANLEKRPSTPRPVTLEEGHVCLAESATGLWALAEGDGHDAARLLLPFQAELVRKVNDGPFCAYLGLRELVLLCRVDDPASSQVLEGLSTSTDGIAGLFTWVEGRLLQRRSRA